MYMYMCMCVYIYIYIYIHTLYVFGYGIGDPANLIIVYCEYIASAKTTSISHKDMLIVFEPRRVGAFEPRRVCGHLLKPCSNTVSLPVVYS